MYTIEFSRPARKFLYLLSKKERDRLEEKLQSFAKNPFADFFDVKNYRAKRKNIACVLET